MSINRPAWVDRIFLAKCRPPGRWFNSWAIAAAILTFLSLLTPGSIQIIPLDSSFKMLLAMPFHLLLYSHLGGLVGLVELASAPVALLSSFMTGEGHRAWNELLTCWSLLPAVIWMLLSWNWLFRLVAQLVIKRRTPIEHRRPINLLTRRWLTGPLLAIVLYGLWFTQLPLKANFALHKGTFERIADEAIAAPNGTVEFKPAQSIGPVQIKAAHRLPLGKDDSSAWGKSPQKQPVISIPIQGFWAHQGYVRDLSRQPREMEAITFSFEPNSNNGDQEIFYLWDGWYAFQNLLD